MAFEIKTEVVINASPKEIWNVLTNTNDYPEWNPFIRSINGELEVDNRIIVQIQPPESKEMVFKPKVKTYTENEEFSWLGRIGMRGIFDGNHVFKLVDNGDGTTTFIQSEKFTGILVPFFKKQLNTNTKEGFIQMNKKLKELTEKK